jgi:VanZ family protein
MQENNIIKLLKIIPAGIYNGMIWFLSSRPLPINIGSFDKMVHITEYSIFGFLLAFMFELTRKNVNPSARYCMIFGAFIGGLDEIHQYFVPGRSCDILDFAADITGTALGILIWLLFIKLLSFIKPDLSTKRT